MALKLAKLCWVRSLKGARRLSETLTFTKLSIACSESLRISIFPRRNRNLAPQNLRKIEMKYFMWHFSCLPTSLLSWRVLSNFISLRNASLLGFFPDTFSSRLVFLASQELTDCRLAQLDKHEAKLFFNQKRSVLNSYYWSYANWIVLEPIRRGFDNNMRHETFMMKGSWKLTQASLRSEWGRPLKRVGPSASH